MWALWAGKKNGAVINFATAYLLQRLGQKKNTKYIILCEITWNR